MCFVQEPVLQRRCPRELAGKRRSAKRDSQRQLGLGKCLVKERNKIFPFCNIFCQLQTVFHYLCATFVCVEMRKIFSSGLQFLDFGSSAGCGEGGGWDGRGGGLGCCCCGGGCSYCCCCC